MFHDSFEFITAPNAQLVSEAEIVFNRQTKNWKSLTDSFLNVVAVNTKQEVIGMASIKGSETQSDYLELGYLFVSSDYRRMGIAAKFTQIRIDYAKKNGVKVLYAIVEPDNHASINNLDKFGFKYYGTYGHIKGLDLSYDWFALVLDETINLDAVMTQLAGPRKRIH
ncbi:GNAT family N-acetyltransferase [Photobacterium damselae subsp. damselae]